MMSTHKLSIVSSITTSSIQPSDAIIAKTMHTKNLSHKTLRITSNRLFILKVINTTDPSSNQRIIQSTIDMKQHKANQTNQTNRRNQSSSNKIVHLFPFS
ncbi:MAG: hypothetical protein EBQ89_01925 [Alphaproteobacteria bacterium]|nr:hypothetical protein [Alphaproteobacteria bacterium]